MVDFLFGLMEVVFAIYYAFGAMRQNVYSSAVFAGGRPLCTQILHGQGRPINHSWHQKTRDTGLPDGENRIPLCSLVLPNTEVWRTDRQTDLPYKNYSFATRCKNPSQSKQLFCQQCLKGQSHRTVDKKRQWVIAACTDQYYGNAAVAAAATAAEAGRPSLHTGPRSI